MRTTRIFLSILVLVMTQWACGSEPVTHEPPPPKHETLTTSPAATKHQPPTKTTTNSIGTVSNILTRVQAGISSNLRDVNGRKELQNNEGVKVTNGGKALLEFPGPINLIVYNESDLQGVNATVQPDSNPRIANRLVRGGMSGYVSPGEQLTIDLAFGRSVTVLGTNFFIVYDEKNDYTTVGKFDGTLIVSIPGKSDVYLDSEMVDIAPNGNTVYYTPIPFTIDQFEQASTNANSSLDGMNLLRRNNNIPIQGPTAIPPTLTPLPEPQASIWLSGGCDQTYDSGLTTQIMTQSNRDGWASVLLGENWIRRSVPIAAGQTLTFDWTIPDTYGAQTLILYLDLGDQEFQAGQCQVTVWDSTLPPSPTAYGPGSDNLPSVEASCPVIPNWSEVFDAGGIQYYNVILDGCTDDYGSCERYQELTVNSTSIDISYLLPALSTSPFYRWAVVAVDNYGNYSDQSGWRYFKNFGCP
jgi:hypothetical protein